MGQETGETQEEVRATRAGIHSELGENWSFLQI